MSTRPTDFDPIEIQHAGDWSRSLVITTNGGPLLHLKASRQQKCSVPEEIVVATDLGSLAAALSKIPGFTASYEQPVGVPLGIGAVVEHDGVLYVRTLTRDDDDHPWRSDRPVGKAANHWHTDEVVAHAIRRGAVIRSEGVPE